MQDIPWKPLLQTVTHTYFNSVACLHGGLIDYVLGSAFQGLLGKEASYKIFSINEQKQSDISQTSLIHKSFQRNTITQAKMNI